MLILPFLLAAVLMAASARLDPPADSTPDEILQLHESIKARFLDARTFGMMRILPRQFHGIRDFEAENPTEQQILTKLQQKGYDVAFFLAGRKILAEAQPLDPRRYLVQGPAFMTPSRKDEFPPPQSLLADSTRALIRFETEQGYNVQKAGWTVALRPLRATSERCIGCHKSGNSDPNLKIGDPIGVAMYVYRRSATPSK